MLLIKTKIQESRIHGIGLFADEFIPKGTEIWKFTPGFDMKFTREEILKFPEFLQIYIYTNMHGEVRRVNFIVFLQIMENTLIILLTQMFYPNIEIMKKKLLLLQ